MIIFQEERRNTLFLVAVGFRNMQGGYNLTFAPPPQWGGGRNKKSEIREHNSKLMRKTRDKKGEEKKWKAKGGKS